MSDHKDIKIEQLEVEKERAEAKGHLIGYEKGLREGMEAVADEVKNGGVYKKVGWRAEVLALLERIQRPALLKPHSDEWDMVSEMITKLKA